MDLWIATRQHERKLVEQDQRIAEVSSQLITVRHQLEDLERRLRHRIELIEQDARDHANLPHPL